MEKTLDKDGVLAVIPHRHENELLDSMHLFDKDGSTVPVDEAYLLESIRNPGAKIVQGYQNVMPATIAEGMTDEQVQDVIEYIKSLQ